MITLRKKTVSWMTGLFGSGFENLVEGRGERRNIWTWLIIVIRGEQWLSEMWREQSELQVIVSSYKSVSEALYYPSFTYKVEWVWKILISIPANISIRFIVHAIIVGVNAVSVMPVRVKFSHCWHWAIDNPVPPPRSRFLICSYPHQRWSVVWKIVKINSLVTV